MTVLVLASTLGEMYAQYKLLEFPPLIGKGQYKEVFDAPEQFLHTHTIVLKDRNVMTIKLWDLKEYKYLENIDSVLQTFLNDISFYSDSLDNLGVRNVRIDYRLSDDDDKSKRIRFQVYEPESVDFAKRKGQISQLKLTYDTVHIVLESGIIDEEPYKYIRGLKSKQHIFLYLNNYTDLKGYIGRGELQSFIDTVYLKANTEKKDKIAAQTTIYYYPYSNSKYKLRYFNTIADFWDPTGNYLIWRYFDKISFHGNIGAGLVRNKLAPAAEAGLEYRDYWIEGKPNYSVIGGYMAPYFLFDKDATGNYNTTISWFACAEIGSSVENDNFETLHIQRLTVGAGYLLNPDGVYFKRISCKVFANLTLSKGITISPEVIATDNFKSIFPGITLKVL